MTVDPKPGLVARTLISQYADSPTLVQLINNMDDYINPDADFDAFYDFVWNVETAQGFGLDIWGQDRRRRPDADDTGRRHPSGI